MQENTETTAAIVAEMLAYQADKFDGTADDCNIDAQALIDDFAGWRARLQAATADDPAEIAYGKGFADGSNNPEPITIYASVSQGALNDVWTPGGAPHINIVVIDYDTQGEGNHSVAEAGSNGVFEAPENATLIEFDTLTDRPAPLITDADGEEEPED